MHIKHYDYISKLSITTQKLKPQNLKICQSQFNELGKSIPSWLPLTFLFRHALVPRSRIDLVQLWLVVVPP